MNNTQQKHGFARRATVGVARAWCYSIGLTSLTRELTRIGGNVSTVAGWVGKKLRNSKTDHRCETFQEAVDRLGLDEAQLIRRAHVFNVRAHSFFAALMLATCWLGGVAWTDAPIAHAVLCVGVMALCFAKTITYRFRYAEIREQEFFDFWPWFFSPWRW